MIEITLSGQRQSGRTTQAVRIARGLISDGKNVALAYPTASMARDANRRFRIECFSTRTVLESPFGWDAVVVDNAEMHEPEVLMGIRNRLEARPSSVLVLVVEQGAKP